MIELSLINSEEKCLIDEDDLIKIKSLNTNWRLNRLSGYVVSTRKYLNRRPIYIHRFILNLTSDNALQVDHINRNKLDNRKENLRACTRAENKANSVKQKGKCHSKYKGVSFYQRSRKWGVHIRFNKKLIYGGRFTSERAAALKANELIKHYYGKFAVLNIISE